MYDCRLTSVEQIISRIVFVTNEDPSERFDLSAQMFSLLLRRWLNGVGHPDTARDFVGEEAYELGRRDRLTRARLFMRAMLDSDAVPVGNVFQFKVYQPHRFRLGADLALAR